MSSPVRTPHKRVPKFSVAILVALVALSAAAVAPAEPTKTQIHEDMVAIADEMRALKPTASQPGNDAAYSELEGRYLDLSRQMGGDDPGSILPGGQPVNGRAPEGGAGGPPPSCEVGEFDFANNTPTTIPTGPAVVTSTVVVAGAGTWLWDLDLLTSITHTFNADLDITLESPAGTVVTLTTDNGSGNDNVFNGTLWDDDANPGGQVPYSSNDGLVADHIYSDLTLASPLVPEEAFGAFVGEDPNGTWTITISDDLPADGGSLDNWTLTVRTLPAPPSVLNTTVVQNSPTAIPSGPAVVTSTVAVAGAGTSIIDVDLTTFLTHTFNADLDITLESPAGTVVTLTTDNGSGHDNVFNGTLWDDDANPGGQVPYSSNNGLVTDHAYSDLTLASPLVPEEALAAFIGEDPNGTWTITISDDLAADGGSLESWTLDIDTATCAEEADEAHFTVTKDFNDDNTAGVDIHIECTTGLPMTSDAVVYEFHDIFDEIEFIVQDYDPYELDCTIHEDVPEGYTQSYAAGYDQETSLFNVEPTQDASGCQFEEVAGGDFTCHITNSLDEVAVTVDKVWIDDQAAENGAFLFAGAFWHCDPVADLNDVSNEPFKGQLDFHGTASDPWDYDTFRFYPHFEGSSCSIVERELDSDIVTDDSDCQDIEVLPGYDLGVEEGTDIPAESCTMINTRVYAGIPTLSEYGLALLALLMLGIGFVGFRRFA